jgi:ketosteroid isomerase-like protein
MKNSILKGILFGCITSLTFACNDKKADTAAPVIDKAAVTREIQTREDEFASVYNAGELKNIGFYADDATSFYQNRPPLVGKDSIIAFLKSDLISNTDKISFKTNEIFPSADGGQVVEIGSFTVVDSANNPINSGNYMSLFEKRDGKYVCLRDMSASDIPRK